MLCHAQAHMQKKKSVFYLAVALPLLRLTVTATFFIFFTNFQQIVKKINQKNAGS